MMRTNLATRPFYNDRLVTLVIGLVAVGVLALTAYNAQQLLALSSRRSALTAKISSDRATATRADAQAVALQQALNKAQMQGLANSAHEANLLIDERTFSWTIFFDLIEKTIPLNVRLQSVAPRVDQGVLVINMTVVSKQQDDVETFVQALAATGVFRDVHPLNEERTDDGMFRVTMRSNYVQPPTPSAPAAKGGRP